MRAGKEPRHRPQSLTTAGNSRSDCPDRHIYDRRGCVVSHPLQSDEENYGPLLLGQFGDGTLHIAKLEPLCLIRRRRQTGRTFLQFDRGALPHGPASEADVLMVQNCE
jgi:hypothetical protein